MCESQRSSRWILGKVSSLPRNAAECEGCRMRQLAIHGVSGSSREPSFPALSERPLQ